MALLLLPSNRRHCRRGRVGCRRPCCTCEAGQLLADRGLDLIFHLAAVVSGEAEADFVKGYAVNLDGTRALLENVRRRTSPTVPPRLVLTSSIAVYGAPPPSSHSRGLPPLLRSRVTAPRRRFAVLLLADYSRRGFVDGLGIRLPTIRIRPAVRTRPPPASSSILREPLVGRRRSYPSRHGPALLSPRLALSRVEFLVHAAAPDSQAVGPRRTPSMPGLSATVGEQIEALRRVAGVQSG